MIQIPVYAVVIISIVIIALLIWAVVVQVKYSNEVDEQGPVDDIDHYLDDIDRGSHDVDDDDLFIENTVADHINIDLENVVTQRSYVELVEDCLHQYTNKNQTTWIWFEVVQSPTEFEVFDFRDIFQHGEYKEMGDGYLMRQSRLLYSGLTGEFPKLFLRTAWDQQVVHNYEPAILVAARQRYTDGSIGFGTLVPDASTHFPDQVIQDIKSIEAYKLNPSMSKERSKEKKVVWRGAASGYRNEYVFNHDNDPLTMNSIPDSWVNRVSISKFCQRTLPSITDIGLVESALETIPTSTYKQMMSKETMVHSFQAILNLQGNSFSGSLGWSLGNGYSVTIFQRNAWETYIAPRHNVHGYCFDDFISLKKACEAAVEDTVENKKMVVRAKEYITKLLTHLPQITQRTLERVEMCYNRSTLNESINIIRAKVQSTFTIQLSDI